MWSLVLLLAAFVAGCGSGSSSNATVAPNSAKSITAYSIAGQVSSSITGTAMAVIMPFGTNKAALVATYATTGASVKVGGVLQTSGTTTNDFSNPVDYLVTAADLTTATYTVTVAEAAAGPSATCTGTTASCVDLGTAANYVIFAGAGVTYTPIATVTGNAKITGNVGVSPAAATSMTGFALTLSASGTFATSTLVTGHVFAANYASPTPAELTTASGDKLIAYTAAAGKPGGTGAGNLNLLAGTIPSGQNFSPGTYTWNSGTPGGNVGMTGNITLTGGPTDVWLFQISGVLDLATAAQITLVGGALPQNVFWQVAGGVNMGTNAHMEGVVMSAATVALNTGATVKGRLLVSDTAAVTMDGNTITQP